MDQLDGEDVLAAESGSLDSAVWSEHDTPLFPLVDSEFDNYSFDPFEDAPAADQEDQCPVTGRQSRVKRLSSLSPPPHRQQQQPLVSNSGRKRPRHCGASPALLHGDVEEQSLSSSSSSSSSSSTKDAERQRKTPEVMSLDSALSRPPHQPSAYDMVDAAVSSESSLGIPLGLLSSLPPNCSVYITHRPASTSAHKSPSPVTQIIINHAVPPSTLPPPPPSPNPPYCMPSLLPLPPSPLSTAADQFHPLDDVRLQQPSPSASLCRTSAPLTTAVRPPKSLSTYAAEFHGRGFGVGDVSTWKYETARRASDSASATAANSMSDDARPGVADRCRRRSSTLLPSSASGVTSPLTPASAERLPVNKFQRPTSLSVPTATVFRQQRPQPSASASSQSPSSRWPRAETDGGVSRSCLEESTADNSSSCDSGTDGTACMLSDALYRHLWSSSSSSSPSSLVDGFDGHADLPSPVPSTDAAATSAAASAKPQQRTIDALSRKLQRNQTKKTEKPTTVVNRDTPTTSFARPDSSCPTPPQSRQLTPTSAFTSTFLPLFDDAEHSASARYDKSCQRSGDVLPKNDHSDVDIAANISTTDDGSKSVLPKDPMLPLRRKRSARRKSQTPRQLPPNDVEVRIYDTIRYGIYSPLFTRKLVAVIEKQKRFIKTCIAGLVLSVTRILRAALTKFRVYVCVTTPPKPLNRFA